MHHVLRLRTRHATTPLLQRRDLPPQRFHLPFLLPHQKFMLAPLLLQLFDILYRALHRRRLRIILLGRVAAAPTPTACIIRALSVLGWGLGRGEERLHFLECCVDAVAAALFGDLVGRAFRS